MRRIKGIKVIAFDADDTLWENETYFREAERHFADLMVNYADREETMRILYEVELRNIPVYGYGIKGFILSMIETANLLSGFRISAHEINELMELGKAMLDKPVYLLDGVEDTLALLSQRYKLVVATKGDLLDQERKLRKSGLLRYFHHIEVMSDKHKAAYESLMAHLDVSAHELLMVGNSLKSDIQPVIEAGAWAVHIPFHTTWQHELVDEAIESPCFFELSNINQLEALL
ncbi:MULTISPECIES: HAD family hydrolase [unclassified Carboxylicivirga]|uniref:HAD family hydrolase n=1 Tax=Carboxylicivirga TaxID=1628153 RepID=UPI003D35020E